jgi:hypothetical protein
LNTANNDSYISTTTDSPYIDILMIPTQVTERSVPP